MSAEPKLLVVDDEDVVCQSCAKILQGQGFKVEGVTDARKALGLLGQADYSAILLDLMMPGFDGLEFLKEFRQRNKTTPVIIITGYPSIDSATQAMRLGVSDYVAKPFTPAEIIAAVSRTLESHRLAAGGAQAQTASTQPLASRPVQAQPAATPPGAVAPRAPAVPPARPATAPRIAAGPFVAQGPEIRFAAESWVAVGKDGTVRLGALLPAARTKGSKGLVLPSPGDTIFRNLPLCAIDGAQGLDPVFSPVSGDVIEVNPARATPGPSPVGDLAATGWLVRVQPTNLEADLAHTAPRLAVLVSADDLATQKERQRLAGLGCQVTIAKTADEAVAALPAEGPALLVIDAPSLGPKGPAIVRAALGKNAAAKALVLDDARRANEGAYKELPLLGTLAKPAPDYDLADMVSSAFVQIGADAQLAPVPKSSRVIRRIRLTNRDGRQVALLADQGLLEEKAGVGGRLVQRILDEAFPLLIGLGSEPLSATRVLEEAAECDRLFIVRAEDLGRLPGSALKDRPVEVVQQAGAAASKITTLTLQPPRGGDGSLRYGPRLDDAVASFLLAEMTS